MLSKELAQGMGDELSLLFDEGLMKVLREILAWFDWVLCLGLAFSAGTAMSKMSPYLSSLYLHEQGRTNISFSLHSHNILYILLL